jgi:hypothetical protein
LSIAGTAIRLMLADVATLEPEAAANMAQAATLDTARLPGRPARKTRMAANNVEVRRISVAMNPMNMNIGTALRDQSPMKS